VSLEFAVALVESCCSGFGCVRNTILPSQYLPTAQLNKLTRSPYTDRHHPMHPSSTHLSRRRDDRRLPAALLSFAHRRTRRSRPESCGLLHAPLRWSVPAWGLDLVSQLSWIAASETTIDFTFVYVSACLPSLRSATGRSDGPRTHNNLD
jgi:hypothetical protein